MRNKQKHRRRNVQDLDEIVKIKVAKTGNIYLNGKAVTVEDFRRELSRLQRVEGAVWYHRENPEDKPSPQAIKVMQTIIRAKLPVKVVTKDFE